MVNRDVHGAPRTQRPCLRAGWARIAAWCSSPGRMGLTRATSSGINTCLPFYLLLLPFALVDLARQRALSLSSWSRAGALSAWPSLHPAPTYLSSQNADRPADFGRLEKKPFFIRAYIQETRIPHGKQSRVCTQVARKRASAE